MSRRAKLRKHAIMEMHDPETMGPESDLASLIFVGAPAGPVRKAIAKFAPKGFTVLKPHVRKLTEEVIRKLKPILGKSVKR